MPLNKKKKRKNNINYFNAIVTQPLTWSLDVWPSQVGDQVSVESVVCPRCEFF